MRCLNTPPSKLKAMLHRSFIGLALVAVALLLTSCPGKDEPVYIVPESGYDWPSQDRAYWPTQGWRSGAMPDFRINPEKMALADRFAREDQLTRALLVIRDGHIVFENYYGSGGPDKSTNLWSCTKSVASAVVGLAMEKGSIGPPDQLMADLMPQYPAFNDIKLQHVLTQTTGLSWVEHGPLWVEWIFSDDWVESALARGQVRPAGEKFFYSSGNSHFLTALVRHRTGQSPGKLAKERLFDPMGIPFDTLQEEIPYSRWEEYIQPLNQSWRKDPQGIECASFSLYLTARDMAKFGLSHFQQFLRPAHGGQREGADSGRYGEDFDRQYIFRNPDHGCPRSLCPDLQGAWTLRHADVDRGWRAGHLAEPAGNLDQAVVRAL